MSDPTDTVFLPRRCRTVLALTERSLRYKPCRSVEGQGQSGLGEVIDLKGTLTARLGREASPGKGRRPAGSQGVGGWEPPPRAAWRPRHPPDRPVVIQDAFPGASSQPLDSLLVAKHRGQSVSSDLSEAAHSVNHSPPSLSSLLLAGFLTEKTKLFCKVNIDHKGYVSPCVCVCFFFNISFFYLN